MSEKKALKTEILAFCSNKIATACYINVHILYMKYGMLEPKYTLHIDSLIGGGPDNNERVLGTLN